MVHSGPSSPPGERPTPFFRVFSTFQLFTLLCGASVCFLHQCVFSVAFVDAVGRRVMSTQNS